MGNQNTHIFQLFFFIFSLGTFGKPPDYFWGHEAGNVQSNIDDDGGEDACKKKRIARVGTSKKAQKKKRTRNRKKKEAFLRKRKDLRKGEGGHFSELWVVCRKQ